MFKQVFYKILSPFRKFYWFVFRPQTFGVKCLIEYNGKFLMIRNIYGRKHWTFPGGGMKKGELPEIAVLREVQEEVGISLGSIKRIGEYKNNKEYKRDTVYCFYVSVQKPEFFIDSSEILEAKWFTLSAIPDFRSLAVDKIFNLL